MYLEFFLSILLPRDVCFCVFTQLMNSPMFRVPFSVSYQVGRQVSDKQMIASLKLVTSLSCIPHVVECLFHHGSKSFMMMLLKVLTTHRSVDNVSLAMKMIFDRILGDPSLPDSIIATISSFLTSTNFMFVFIEHGLNPQFGNAIENLILVLADLAAHNEPPQSSRLNALAILTNDRVTALLLHALRNLMLDPVSQPLLLQSSDFIFDASRLLKSCAKRSNFRYNLARHALFTECFPLLIEAGARLSESEPATGEMVVSMVSDLIQQDVAIKKRMKELGMFKLFDDKAWRGLPEASLRRVSHVGESIRLFVLK
jgi:hypothetical protein